MKPKQAPAYARQLFAEVLGTAALVVVAAGADTIDAMSAGGIGHVARYFSPGLAIVALIWTFSGISGAHLNPAVTFAFVLRGAFQVSKALGYAAAQLAGALAGAALLRIFFGEWVAKGVTHPGLGISPLQACGWEATITALLVLVVLGTAAEKAVVGKNAALAVGFTVALCGLASSPITGASMNPARSFGPAAVSGDWADIWIYALGPLTGAAIAALISWCLHGSNEAERAAAHGSDANGV